MPYDKAVVNVVVEHEGIVSEVRDLVDELNDPESFMVRVVNEEMYTEGSSVDGSKVLTVEVHEYAGEIPLFIHSVKEKIDGAEIGETENYRGESEVPGAVESRS